MKAFLALVLAGAAAAALRADAPRAVPPGGPAADLASRFDLIGENYKKAAVVLESVFNPFRIQSAEAPGGSRRDPADITNEAIVAEVAAKPGAIGYTGIGALRGGGTRIKVVALAVDAESPPITATPETIVSGSYPLSRKLHLATMGPPFGTAKAFIDFCLSDSGQSLFQRVGLVPVKSAMQ